MYRRLTALLVCCFALGTAATAQEAASAAPAGLARIAQQVQSQRGWTADAATCPAQAFPKQPAALAVTDCRGTQAGTCFNSCSTGNASACYTLGQLLQKDQAVAAETLHQRACRLGIVSGCTNRAAGILRDRPTDEPALACVARTFAMGCDANDPWACTMHALNLALGQGVEQDRQKAVQLVQKACRLAPADESCAAGNRIKGAMLEADADAAAAPASAPASR